MKKNAKGFIVLAAFTAMAVAAFSFYLYSHQNGNVKEGAESNIVRPIVCFGDSLTEGVGGEGTNYPDELATLIKSYFNYEYNSEESAAAKSTAALVGQSVAEKIVVYNEGNSGESSISIAARSGGVPMITSSDISFSRLSAKTKITFLAEDGRVIEPWHSKSYSTDVTIAGVSGKLTFNEDKYSYYFTRDSFWHSEYIPAGSYITIDKNYLYEDALTIVFAGQNGGYDSAVDLIAQQKSMIPEEIYESGLYLILGLTSGNEADRAQLEAAMEAEYGSNYINLRKLMTSERVSEFADDLSASDFELMQQGTLPQALRAFSDEVHLNAAGYRMVAQLVFERMKDEGMLDKLIAH